MLRLCVILIFAFAASATCNLHVLNYTSPKGTGYHIQDVAMPTPYGKPDLMGILFERIDHKDNHIYLYSGKSTTPIGSVQLPGRPSTTLDFSTDKKQIFVFNDEYPLLYSISPSYHMTLKDTEDLSGSVFFTDALASSPKSDFITCEKYGNGVQVQLRSKDDLSLIKTLHSDEDTTATNVTLDGEPGLLRVSYGPSYDPQTYIFYWDTGSNSYIVLNTPDLVPSSYKLIGSGLAATADDDSVSLFKFDPKNGNWIEIPDLPCAATDGYDLPCEPMSISAKHIGAGRYDIQDLTHGRYTVNKYSLSGKTWEKDSTVAIHSFNPQNLDLQYKYTGDSMVMEYGVSDDQVVDGWLVMAYIDSARSLAAAAVLVILVICALL